MSELLHVLISEFKGKYPEIPLPEDIDRDAFGDKPFFVTLPIGEVGARSRNKRTYTRASIQEMVDQVNERRPRGWWGHPEPGERSTTAPALQWLAAILDEDGKAWGKCVTLAENAREYLKAARATRTKVGTSILGTAAMDGDKVVSVDLSFIDLVADPNWVGVPATAATPHLTKETRLGAGEDKQGGTMPDGNEQLIAELRTDRDTARTKATELEKQIGELQPLADQAKAVREVIAEYADSFASASISVNASGTDIVQVIRELADKLVAMSAEGLQARINAVVGETIKVPTDTKEGKALLKYVLALLGKVKDEEEARKRLAEIMEDETHQILAKAVVKEVAGGNVVVSDAPRQGTSDWRQNVADNAEKIAGEIGVKK